MSTESSSVMTNIGIVFVKGNPSEEDLVAVREAINIMHKKSTVGTVDSEKSFNLWNNHAFRLGLFPRNSSSAWRSSVFFGK